MRRFFRSTWLCIALAVGGASFALPALAQSPEEVAAVFRDLENTDSQAAARAEERLRQLWKELWSGDITPALPELADRLRDESAVVRRYAALTLAGAAINDPQNAERLHRVSPTLVLALGDPDPAVRQAAATAVSSMRPTPPAEATAALLGLLADPAVDVRRAALAGLARMRPAPPELREVAIEQLRTRSPLEPQAIRILGALPIDDPEVVELVAERLESSDAALRTEAVQALSHWGEAARPALPRLRKMADDPGEDETLRRLAQIAAEQIAGEASQP